MQTPPLLSSEEARDRIASLLPVDEYRDRRVLLIIPDATRTAPLPLLFASVYDQIGSTAKKLDVLVALGTHPPMPESQIAGMLGIYDEATGKKTVDVGLFNHEWDQPERLTEIGTLTREDTSSISGGLLEEEVSVQINARIKDYDVLLVMGPVFPHEVVGFSGGNKYFFPGISGPDLLNFFHWLGALITNVGIIGNKHTPVRAVVDKSASMIPVERRCLAFVVNGKADLYGIFYGTPEGAWNSAADLSDKVHIRREPRAYKQVLSCAPPMYDELWVAGKCMYKLEPVVADGGELIIYAPHLNEISITHGRLIEEVGYHVREYFTEQWDKFKDFPWGVLAHSTHVRGTGSYKGGIEKPRVQVTLASGIPKETCERINLGYRDPNSIDVESFANREDEGILLVRKAGEQLYRLKQ